VRVALCLFGQPRFVDNPYGFDSHFNNIISKYDADVFAHAWIPTEQDGNITPYETSYWVNTEVFPPKDSETIILDKYKPLKYSFEPPQSFSLKDSIRDVVKDLEYYKKTQENNLISHLYSLSKSIKLLCGLPKYDWVIISRYDNYIHNMPNLTGLPSDELYLSSQYSHFVDVLMFGGQSQIESMICDDDSTIEYLCNHINNFTPEEFKRVSFNRYYKTECRIPIGVGILRSSTLEGLQE
jgi:hypothetical protein